MKYAKPEVVVGGLALLAIQGQHSKPDAIYLDAAPSGPNQGQFNATISAYEADE